MSISRSSFVSRWHYWIRAWDSGEPATSHRQLEHSNALHSGVQGWADPQIRRPLHSGHSLARPHDRYEYAISRVESDGSFKAGNDYFSLCTIAQSEPSRSGAGTWRRQAHSRAAPGCRRVRVQHERTGAMARKNMPASPARWVMDQLHKRDTTTVWPTSAHTSSTKHQPALSDDGHNMAHRPGEQGPRREVPRGGSGVVRIDRANGK